MSLGITCLDGRVTAIAIEDKGIAGYFLESFGGLQFLTDLRLGKNNLQGSIAYLAPLNQLSYVDISENSGLTGDLEAIRNWPSVWALAIFGCSFSGSVSSISSLHSLMVLDASSNRLTGNLEPFRDLTVLIFLELSHNNLIGPLDYLNDLPLLAYLYLASNALSGSLSALVPLTSLLELTLDSNMFRGDLSPLSGLVSLTKLSVSNNLLEGELDPLEGLEKLTYLRVDANQVRFELRRTRFLRRILSIGLCVSEWMLCRHIIYLSKYLSLCMRICMNGRRNIFGRMVFVHVSMYMIIFIK